MDYEARLGFSRGAGQDGVCEKPEFLARGMALRWRRTSDCTSFDTWAVIARDGAHGGSFPEDSHRRIPQNDVCAPVAVSPEAVAYIL
jgi:hypothetical protein